MSAAFAFEYPATKHVWRHGPLAYADYESYRDWLRDEFSFRCVFCLRREQWDIRLGMFHIDHFCPQSVDPESECNYENLLYVCSACNLKKSDLRIPHPCAVAFGQCLRVHPDGTIEATDIEGEILIELLRLDDGDCTRYRKLYLEIIAMAEEHNREIFVELMRFPDDLPDLSQPRRRPPGGNGRPAGIAESWFARRERGELPATY